MAFLSLVSKTPFELFESEFTAGQKNMLINGLVWMGEESFMKQQIEEKLAQGFTCIKLKIGAIEEAAFKMGFIDAEQLKKIAEPLLKSGYGKHLISLI